MKQWQRYLAELFGTFTLVFLGCTAIVAAGTGEVQIPALIGIPFAFGFALLVALYAFGEVSGGHFNPAVSLAMFLDRRLSAPDLVSYWIAQFVGATLAAALMLIPFTDDAVAATATVPSSDGTAVFIEAAMTALFVLVILQATKSKAYGSSALIAIPLTLMVIHFASLPFSGASVNPARTLGPALVGDRWDSEWIYFLGPALGAIIGWLVYEIVVKGDTDLRDDIEAVKREVGGMTG